MASDPRATLPRLKAGCGELSAHVAIQPTTRAERAIRAYNADFVAGEAFASGWLERESGKWLQTSTAPTGSIRQILLERLPERGWSP